MLKRDHDKAYNNLGIVLARSGRLPEAVASYEAALRIRPDVSMVWSNLANAQAGLLRYREAIASYRKALDLDPDNLDTRGRLAMAYAAAGDREAALWEIEAVRRIDPGRAAILSQAMPSP